LRVAVARTAGAIIFAEVLREGKGQEASMEEKERAYRRTYERLASVIENEGDLIARMASAACLLHTAFEQFLWTGFYRMADGELVVGPYQGTLGCLRIELGKGVCGTAARKKETVLVKDVHEFPGHIACDPRSKSEIVVPVFDGAGELIAVLDVDSDRRAAFDETDKLWLERVAELVGRGPAS